jgi:hypothetical protein
MTSFTELANRPTWTPSDKRLRAGNQRNEATDLPAGEGFEADAGADAFFLRIFLGRPIAREAEFDSRNSRGLRWPP